MRLSSPSTIGYFFPFMNELKSFYWLDRGTRYEVYVDSQEYALLPTLAVFTLDRY